MVALTDPRARNDGAPASLAEIWLSDLAWHKYMYRPVRYRWDTHDVIDLIAERASGQLDFSTVEDLRRLDGLQQSITGLTERVLDEMATRCVVVVDAFSQADLEALHHLHDTTIDPLLTTHTAGPTTPLRPLGVPALPLDATVQVTAGVTGQSALEVNALLTRAALPHHQHGQDEHQDPAAHSADDDELAGALKGIPVTNPLTETWELKQLLALCEAADAMLEDTICDLLTELAPTRPAGVLASVSGSPTTSAMQARIAAARRARGGPGDERRLPGQSL